MTSPASVADGVGPRFLSLAERDRRFAAIRARMAVAGLDVLILPASANRWEQSMADSRYVTGIGGFGTETLTIVPKDGPPTAYLFNRSGWWRAQPGHWLDDVRDGRNHWAANAIERLRELGFERGTAGLSGLAGQTRTPDGVIPQKTYAALHDAFPHASFVDATALVAELRSIKSDEEIATLEAAAAVTDAMVATMIATARPGTTERHVYAAMVQTMLLAGAELPSLLIFASGPGRTMGHGQFVPVARVLADGDLLVNEIEARVAGYGAQTVAPVWLGKPDAQYRAAIAIAGAAFEAVRAEMRPGATMGGLMDVYYATLKREGGPGWRGSFPLMHARGLGDEVPAVIDAADLEKNRDIALHANMAFVVKPSVRAVEGGLSAQIGDTVVVTPSGGRRLGKRPLELAIVG